jgi:hypothetical protein
MIEPKYDLTYLFQEYAIFIISKYGIMKKVILLLLVLVAFKCSPAQQITIPTSKPIVKLSDTLIVINSFPYYNRVKPTSENMPNPYKGMGNQLTKIGSDRNGIDLYQSKPDNMIVLKPDSINLALTYIPNGYALDDKMFFSNRPRMKAFLDTLSGIKITVRPSAFPIAK